MPQQILRFRSQGGMRLDIGTDDNWATRALAEPQRSSGRIYLLELNSSVTLMPVREGSYHFESQKVLALWDFDGNTAAVTRNILGNTWLSCTPNWGRW